MHAFPTKENGAGSLATNHAPKCFSQTNHRTAVDDYTAINTAKKSLFD